MDGERAVLHINTAAAIDLIVRDILVEGTIVGYIHLVERNITVTDVDSATTSRCRLVLGERNEIATCRFE